MALSVPAIVMPATVMVFALPTVLSANEPVAALVSIVTVSPDSMPTSAADPSCKIEVALVLAL